MLPTLHVSGFSSCMLYAILESQWHDISMNLSSSKPQNKLVWKHFVFELLIEYVRDTFTIGVVPYNYFLTSYARILVAWILHCIYEFLYSSKVVCELYFIPIDMHLIWCFFFLNLVQCNMVLTLVCAYA